MKYEPTIGLEIHAELKTRTKMFCDSLNDPDEKHPNVNICPVCVGHPGTLPVINQEAIQKLIKVGLALNCQIAELSKFDRKNYFYPDLPKGYQISQYDLPICHDGYLTVNDRKIRIQRIHMEEDTGRLLHPVRNRVSNGASGGERKYSLVDFNRAGIPLMELVTMPDIKTGEEVMVFAKELQLILRYLGASDADMEKGQMRVEVNISLAPLAAHGFRLSAVKKLGTKVEIKNINSINAAARAANYEIKRQTELLERGKKIIQETRGWDENKGQTFSQRIKEGSADYRYFPEPDLPPMRFSQETVDEIKSTLPELPEQRRKRFREQYDLNDSQIGVFTITKNLGDYFEKIASELDSWDNFEHLERPGEEHKNKLYTMAANYLITEFPPLFQAKGLEINDLEGIKITPAAFGELVVRIFHKELSSTGAKTVLQEMFGTGLTPGQIMKEGDLGQVSDAGELQKIVEEVIAKNSKAVEDFKKGKKESLKFLVGQVMAHSKGKANPQMAQELLEKILH